MFDEPHDLFDIFGMLLNIVLYLLLFFCDEFRGASTPLVIIQSRKTSRVPSIKPVINGQTRNSKDLHEIKGGHAIKTQQNTMGTLPNPLMMALLMQSTKEPLGFRA